MGYFWLLPVALRVSISNGIGPYIQKHMTGKPTRLKIFTIQFVAAFIIATVLALALGQYDVSTMTLAVSAMAFVNCFGAYCQWRAIDISLSRNALFTIWDDIIPMILALIFIGETKILGVPVVVGLALSFLAIALLSYSERVKRELERAKSLGEGKRRPSMSRLALFILGYSVPFGFTNFFMRYWALSSMPAVTFVSSWYRGSIVAALLMLVVGTAINRKNEYLAGPVGKGNAAVGGTMGLLGVGNMLLAFWATSLAPILATQPIGLLSEIVIPSIIGLKLFREHKTMIRLDWIAFGIALLAGVLIAIGIS